LDKHHIAQAYSGYHTHTPVNVTPQGPSKAWQKLWIQVRNGYLNNRYGWKFTQASPIGRFFIPLIPGRIVHCGHLIRHFERPIDGGKLLDIGCGAGVFLGFALEGGWQVCGLEPDEQAAQASSLDDGVISIGGLPDTGFPDAQFDAILLNHVIEHVHEPREALLEVMRLLRAGGQATVITPSLSSWSHAIYNRNWRGLEPPRHLALFNRPAIERLCRQIGFRTVEFKPSRRNARYYLWPSEEIRRNAAGKPRMGYVMRGLLRCLAFILDSLKAIFPDRDEEIVLVLRK